MARILFFDIETAGVNALKSDLGFVILFGYKWSDEKETHCIQIDRKSLDTFSDKKLLMQASKLFLEADLIVGHYASIFDARFINGRLLINNLPPIPPVKLRDTKFMASVQANFSSNRLKHLAKILGLRHQKLENNWPMAWFQVMRGNMKTLNEMAEYCKGDVIAMEELYYRLRPFDKSHPRIVPDKTKCAACGGGIQYRGFAVLDHNRYRRFQCQQCGKWDRERKAIKC